MSIQHPEPPADVWQFPCRLDLKVVCHNDSDAVSRIVAAIQSQIAGDYSPRSRLSREGHYISVTVGVSFADKPQLLAVYAALKALPGVKMVL